MCGGNDWMWNGGYGGWGWAGWIVTAIVLVVAFALVLTAVVAAVRYLTSGGQTAFRGDTSGRSADDVLAERYARGDIDDDEYRRRTALLAEHK